MDPLNSSTGNGGYVRAGRVAALALAITGALVGSAHAATAVPLGVAESFALLGGSTITNTGPTTVSGDIGLCCTGLATPGFGSLTQPQGAQYVGPGTVAATAQDDLDVAYANAAGQAVTNTVPVDLSLTGTPASPLRPGVYQSTAHGALQINTGLTLDFGGDPNAVFIFQGTTLTTAAGAGGSVTIVNGGSTPSTCNVYWQLSDATQGVTLGTASAFDGTTMALGASVLGTGATVTGRILTRRSAAVTLDSNTITRSPCQATAAGSGSGSPTPAPAPTPPAGPTGPTTPIAASPTPGASGAPLFSPTPGSVPAAPPGIAHLFGPHAPVGRPFTVTVTGHAIQTVVFSIDGHRVATVSARPGRTRFRLRIDPRRQHRGVHRVSARVTFRPAGRTPKTTLTLDYRRPTPTSLPPRFTG